MVRSNSRSHLGMSRRHRKQVGVRTFWPSCPPAPPAPSTLCPQPRSHLCPPLPTRPLCGGLCRPSVSGRACRPATLLPLWLHGTHRALACSRVWVPCLCGVPRLLLPCGCPQGSGARPPFPAPCALCCFSHPPTQAEEPSARRQITPSSTYTGGDHADPMVGLSPTHQSPGLLLTQSPPFHPGPHSTGTSQCLQPRPWGPGRVGTWAGGWGRVGPSIRRACLHPLA